MGTKIHYVPPPTPYKGSKAACCYHYKVTLHLNDRADFDWAIVFKEKPIIGDLKHHPECECDKYKIINFDDDEVPSWTLEDKDWERNEDEGIKTFTFSFLSECKDERMGAEIELFFKESYAQDWRKRNIDGSGVITGPIPSS